MDKLVKQGIDNCFMAKKYEHPGYEDGMCSGLRTMEGQGEPAEYCKECRLYYGYMENHDETKTNYDVCCESVETMAQIVDVMKCGWEKEKIIEWLNMPVVVLGI